LRRSSGNSDTRMIERRYAHLAPSRGGEVIRAAFAKLDLIDAG
jgi:hypothetical protein